MSEQRPRRSRQQPSLPLPEPRCLCGCRWLSLFNYQDERTSLKFSLWARKIFRFTFFEALLGENIILPHDLCFSKSVLLLFVLIMKQLEIG